MTIKLERERMYDIKMIKQISSNSFFVQLEDDTTLLVYADKFKHHIEPNILYTCDINFRVQLYIIKDNRYPEYPLIVFRKPRHPAVDATKDVYCTEDFAIKGNMYIVYNNTIDLVEHLL